MLFPGALSHCRRQGGYGSVGFSLEAHANRAEFLAGMSLRHSLACSS